MDHKTTATVLLIFTALIIVAALSYAIITFWLISLCALVIISIAAGLWVIIPTVKQLLQEAHQQVH